MSENGNIFRSILENRSDGSTQILISLIDFLLGNWEEITASDYKMYIKQVTDEFPDMKIIANMAEKINDLDKNQIREILTEYREKLDQSCDIIASKFNNLLKGDKLNILTFSNSYTIENVLIKSDTSKIVKIYLYESNPGGEGRVLAKRLKRIPSIESKIKLVSDMEGDNLIRDREVDFILFGSDAYAEDRWFVNKIGSDTIAKLARDNNVNILVLTSKSKEIKRDGIASTISPILEYIKIDNNIYFITD